MGLISLLCKILRHATVTVPNAEPAEDDLSIDGDPTFTYHDGKWYSGKLKLAVKDGSSLADYQGTYTLNLPDGVTTTTGETTVKSGEEFQLVSDTRPSTADKDTYQSMIGAAFGEKAVSAKSAFKVEDEGTLKIVKYAKDVDGKADDSQPIKDVEFTITGPNDYSKTAKTDENGEISLSGLTPGKYTITESDVTDAEPKVEAPDAADKTQTVTVEADKTKTVTATFSDKLTKGNLEVVKYAKDADGNVDTSKPIKGVEFTITGPNDYFKTVKTDENGKISLQGLTPGEYTVTESSVDGASPAVEAPSADDKKATAKVYFSDELKPDKTGTFTIQKYIKDTTTGVKGVQFKTTGPDSQVDGKTFTTDKDGKITLPTELKSGKYTITELTTPGDGFTDTVELLAQTKTITIKADGTTSATNDTVVFEDNAKTRSSSSSESSSSSTGSSTSSSMSSSSSSENSSSSTSSSSPLPVSSESSSLETSSNSSDSSSTPVTPAESSSTSGTEILGVESSSTTSTFASAVPTTPSAPAASASSAKKSFVSGLLPQTGQAKSLLWILLGVVIVAGVAIKLYLDKKKK